MGRTPYSDDVEIILNGKSEIRKIDFFAWEKTDYAEKIRKSFNL